MNPQGTQLIKDLINLPDKVLGGDFVLKLTEGVQHPEQTLRSYVVTEQLAHCFDNALDFIHGSVQQNSSKAAYLHGSFGAGKSHFMAVLHLLLQQNAAARAKEGLAGVITKHDSWLEGKRFLLVSYHMIGQSSMEAAVLGGYVRRVLELHPEAPIPAVYRAEGLFHDAKELRKTMGDDSFFETLNRGVKGGGGDGWGDLESTWDAVSFEVALEAAPGSDDRSRLIGALVEEFFQSYKEVARGSDEAYVSLDDGLAIISRHAQSLGYDALVLFLDELILWLATHAADQQFLNEEGPKVSKLVEAENADRPIPIVSLVARQRDLRELVGDAITGAQQLTFVDVLNWWEARFDKISLEDRNLPEIAARRVLAPKNEAARQEFARAWETTKRIRDEVFQILLTPKADPEVFRKVYPFSPALVETLVAVSSVLQRERTALKVMLQILVNQRETLELGQIVPVGDLYDVIAEGASPFTLGMQMHFDNAKRLYHQKLRPMLEKEHDLSADEVAALPHDDPKARIFRADDRLVKTLLLSALVPEVEALKGLNSARLAALNHGSITAPVAGRERQEVLRRVRNWAAQVGEVRVGEEADPVISLQLSGVDTESILANAQAVDNQGNRRRKVREILFEQLGIHDGDDLFLEHGLAWRGTRRTFQIIFTNVRELTAESLDAKGGSRKLILDFPFDEPGFTPADDLARLDQFREAGKPSRTLVWLPAFLSREAQSDLGTLVKLDDILRNDESFRRNASHLSGVEQAQARELLRNQQSSLRQRLIRFIEGAYGVDNPVSGSIDEANRPDNHFQSLDPTFVSRPPVGANLRQAAEHLLGQMLENQFPAHPEFGTELKTSTLRKVREEVERAAQNPDGRVAVDKPLRSLMREIAVPLRLGDMGDTHFALRRHWYDHFNREVQEQRPTVGQLRAAMDEPRAMGLPTSAQNLVIQVYADQANRSFFLHGGPYRSKGDDYPDELELREQSLPSESAWDEGLARAGKVFGITVSPLRNASNASELSNTLKEKAANAVASCQGLKDRLDSLCADFSIDVAQCPRHQSATAVLDLVGRLAAAGDDSRIDILATAKVATSLDAMGTSYKKAADVLATIEATKWELFDAVAGLSDERAAAAQGLREQLVDALNNDEYAVALGSRLKKLETDAIRLLTPPAVPPSPGPQPGSLTPPQPAPNPSTEPSGAVVVADDSRQVISASDLSYLATELREKLDADPSLKLDLSWRLYREKGGK